MSNVGKKSAIADLSVEIGHLYLSDLKFDSVSGPKIENTSDFGERPPDEGEPQVDDLESYVTRRLDRGVAAVSPIVKRYRASKKKVSTAVLIDDYFYRSSSDSELLERVVAAIMEYAETTKHGIQLDYVVFEADLAESVRTLINLIAREPSAGAGSRSQELEYDDRWLGNGQAGRGRTVKKTRRLGRVEASPIEEPTAGANKRQHSIAMDIELLSSLQDGSELWSCPLLAAWWQLVRLGMLRDEHGEPTMPTRTIALGLDKNVPLHAKRTLTALVPEFLEVEAAVQTILRQTALTSDLRAHLKDSRREIEPSDHLKRISYVFVDDFFHPIGLRRASDWSRG